MKNNPEVYKKWINKKIEAGYVHVHLFVPKEILQQVKDAKAGILNEWKVKKGV